jgi:hypothetical protein
MIQNSRNQGFSYYFCLTIEGAGFVQIMRDPGCPKNLRIPRIQIHNTAINKANVREMKIYE